MSGGEGRIYLKRLLITILFAVCTAFSATVCSDQTCLVSIRRVSWFDQTVVLFRSDGCLGSTRRLSCFDQTGVLVRPDGCPVSDVCLGSTRRLSCFDQTGVLVRPDGCPVSIRRVSWFEQTVVLFRSDSSRRIGSSRLVSAAHLGFTSFARLGSTALLVTSASLG